MALTPTEVIAIAKKELSKLTGRQPSTVVSVSREADGWHITLEMVERKAIPDRMDLLANYEVLVDDEGSIVRFHRGSLRTRSETTKYRDE
jgi:hypothetical protein